MDNKKYNFIEDRINFLIETIRVNIERIENNLNEDLLEVIKLYY